MLGLEYRSFRTKLSDPFRGDTKELQAQCTPFFGRDNGYDFLFDNTVSLDKDETIEAAGIKGGGREREERRFELIVRGAPYNFSLAVFVNEILLVSWASNSIASSGGPLQSINEEGLDGASSFPFDVVLS